MGSAGKAPGEGEGQAEWRLKSLSLGREGWKWGGSKLGRPVGQGWAACHLS